MPMYLSQSHIFAHTRYTLRLLHCNCFSPFKNEVREETMSITAAAARTKSVYQLVKFPGRGSEILHVISCQGNGNA